MTEYYVTSNPRPIAIQRIVILVFDTASKEFEISIDLCAGKPDTVLGIKDVPEERITPSS